METSATDRDCRLRGMFEINVWFQRYAIAAERCDHLADIAEPTPVPLDVSSDTAITTTSRPCSVEANGKEPMMKIAVVGAGNVGGGLADLWKNAGHDIVARLGKEGGDVSDAHVVLVAVPGASVADALDNIHGISGKTVIDATNLIGAEPPAGFASNAEFVKSKTNGPTAKSFNLNFANQYDKLGVPKSRPSNVWSGDEEARPIVEQLNRDAGYQPVRLGGLDKAALQEHATGLIFAIAENIGPFFYRFAPPEQF
jgi:8-hydroxy-5-deazaflavin:NADPH oxidoreductase